MNFRQPTTDGADGRARNSHPQSLGLGLPSGLDPESWVERYGERAPAALREWQELLERPWQEVLATATELSEDAARLRQSSPLATLLSSAERRRVYDAFRA